MRKLVNLVVINNGELLLVKKDETWILPGGEPEKNESDLGCLIKEVKKGLPGTQFSVNSHYRTFDDEENELKAVVYFGGLKSPLGKPSSEISDRRFVDSFDKYNLLDITKKIIDSLIKDNYL